MPDWLLLSRVVEKIWLFTQPMRVRRRVGTRPTPQVERTPCVYVGPRVDCGRMCRNRLLFLFICIFCLVSRSDHVLIARVKHGQWRLFGTYVHHGQTGRRPTRPGRQDHQTFWRKRIQIGRHEVHVGKRAEYLPLIKITIF